MELYHGSERIIHRPFLNGGRPDNDFGRGLYCTETAELAMEWACKDTDRNAFVNKYELDTKGLSCLKLTSPEYHILNWLALLLKFRNPSGSAGSMDFGCEYILDEFLPDISQYDIIVGYRVDDSYFSIARAFLNNTISLRVLSRAMHLGKLGEQVCLKSETAFDRLLFLGYFPVPYEEYYAKKMSRDLAARSSFRQLSQSDSSQNDIWLLDIVRSKIKNNDPRLF